MRFLCVAAALLMISFCRFREHQQPCPPVHALHSILRPPPDADRTAWLVAFTPPQSVVKKLRVTQKPRNLSFCLNLALSFC